MCWGWGVGGQDILLVVSRGGQCIFIFFEGGGGQAKFG